jgi:hypothetical protein
MNNEELKKEIMTEIEYRARIQKISVEIRKLYPDIPSEQLLKVVGDFFNNLQQLELLSMIGKNDTHIPKID